jgi:predicted DNA-binding transcriptional regulator AlpA
MSNLPIGTASFGLAGLPPEIGRHRVVCERAAAEFCGVAAITLERMRKSGTGPPYVRLSERRLGYRMGDLCNWLESRLSEAGATSETA